MNEETVAVPTYGPSPVVYEELKRANPRAKLLVHSKLEQCVVVKPISRVEYQRFRRGSDDPAKRQAATENLVRACVVWPEKAALDQQFEDFPALHETWGTSLLRLAGLSADEDIEKKAL